MSGSILSLLGLALRGGRLAPGDEPAALAAKAGQARLLLLASDAAERTARRTESLAREGHCLWLVLPFSKEELGGALGWGSVAVAALTDTGLAAAVTERLAALDPDRYAEAAARMDLKRRRAKERQSAPRRDPPGRDPSPRREERRRAGPENRNRTQKGGRGTEARRDRPPRSHRQDSGPRSWASHGKPPRSGGKSRPGGGRPYNGQTGRPQSGNPPGKGRPCKNKGGPRSGGGGKNRQPPASSRGR